MIADRAIHLEVDGGLSPATAREAAARGADILVAGSAIFKGGPTAYATNIEALRQAAIEGSRE
jgi:ribulose-phosphate 3-epimerase